jgi:hypothetical protein
MKLSKEKQAQIKKVITEGILQMKTQVGIQKDLEAIGYSVSRERVRQRIKKLGLWETWKEKQAEYSEQEVFSRISAKAGYFGAEDKGSDKWSLAYKKYMAKKASAAANGTPFSLEFDDVVWPDNCPILGIPLDYSGSGRKENSPTFDQVRAGEGYNKDNVMIISWRANRIKNDGTADEHRLIAEFMELDFEEVFNGIEARLLKKRQEEQIRKADIVASYLEQKRTTVGVKKCSHCGEEKPVTDFYINNRAKDGRSSWCVECTKKNVKIHHEANKHQRMKKEANDNRDSCST